MLIFNHIDTQVNDEKIKVQVWTAYCFDNFTTLSKPLFKNTHSVAFVFDITSRESFDLITNWIKNLNREEFLNIYFIIIGNKKDMESERLVTKNEAEEFAKQYNLEYFETSAAEDNEKNQIPEVFEKIVQGISNIQKNEIKPNDSKSEVNNQKCNIA